MPSVGPPPCKAESCDRIASKRGLCGLHYQRWRKHGDINHEYDHHRLFERPPCSAEGCSRPQFARSLCTKHYQRLRATGSTADPKRLSTEERFWAKVDKKAGPPRYRPELGSCWVWMASLDRKGYGQFNLRGRPTKLVRAHRFAYEHLVGECPGDRPHLDHLCRNRACVNPVHLEPVTNAENTRRGLEARRSAA